MYIVAIVQARMGSMRFPNKVMQSIGIGVPMIEVLLSRLSKSKEIDKIILATSNDQCNKTLVEHVSGLGYDVYQGSENDVLDRYYKAAMEQKNLSAIVRITGDCPLVDPDIVDTVIKKYKSSDAEYVSNTNPPTYPDGMDVEVFSLFSLKMAWKNTKTQYEREHVTPFMRKPGKFKIENISNSKDYSDERLTVDSTEDLEVVREVFKYFHPKIDFSWLDIMKLRDGSPEIFMKNQNQFFISCAY